MRPRRLLAFLLPALLLTGCAALASVLGVAAPIAADALGKYAAAAADAQRQAGLPSTDPEVIALRTALASLAAAERGAEQAREPVTCAAPPVAEAPPPAPAVDVDKLAAALESVAASNRAVVDALQKVKRKAKKKTPAAPLPSSVLPFVDASAPISTSDASPPTDSGAP